MIKRAAREPVKNAYSCKNSVFVHKLLKFHSSCSCDGPVECCAGILDIVFKLKSCIEAIYVAVSLVLAVAGAKCVERVASIRCAWVQNKAKCEIKPF